jgi:hypothetical protein
VEERTERKQMSFIQSLSAKLIVKLQILILISHLFGSVDYLPKNNIASPDRSTDNFLVNYKLHISMSLQSSWLIQCNLIT